MVKKRILLVERKLFENDTRFSSRINEIINNAETLTPPLEIGGVTPLMNGRGRLKGVTLYLQSNIEEKKEKKKVGFQ